MKAGTQLDEPGTQLEETQQEDEPGSDHEDRPLSKGKGLVRHLRALYGLEGPYRALKGLIEPLRAL